MHWKPEHDRALDHLIVDLGTGKEYCHTKRLHIRWNDLLAVVPVPSTQCVWVRSNTYPIL